MDDYDDFSDIDAIGAARGDVAQETPQEQQQQMVVAQGPPVLAPIHSPPPAPTQRIAQDGTIVSSGSGYVYPMSPTPFQGRELVGAGAIDMGTAGKPTMAPILAAAAGATAGGMYAGVYGAGAGLLLTGAAVNAYRLAANADPSKKAVHGVFVVVSGALGGYLAYMAWKKKAGKDNG